MHVLFINITLHLLIKKKKKEKRKGMFFLKISCLFAGISRKKIGNELGSWLDAELCVDKAKSFEFYSSRSWHTTG
jgi:hypothetical protein